MITKINHTEEFMVKSRANGTYRLLNSPEDIARMQAMNESLERDHQEFLWKQAESERLASECYLD